MTTKNKIDPTSVQKEYREFLRKEGLPLKSLGLAEAFDAVVGFYSATHGNYEVLRPDGDGIAFSVAVNSPRLVIYVNRLLRLPPPEDQPHIWPAIRLWTMVQYKFEQDVIQYLALSAQSQAPSSFVSWSPDSLNGFTDAVRASDAYKTFGKLKPTEVRVASDEWGYNKHIPHPSPTDGPWWGDFDVH